jgi:hypothetical protein
LPEAISSFGAAVSGDHVYVYGGHLGRSHEYSTASVSNKFRRLKIPDPAAGWEDLPSGPAVQGVALVAHGGKLYRIGGMQPRNKPGEKSDNVSIPSVAVFDPKSKVWDSLPNLPKGRSSHDAVVVGDRIVVTGGWCMNGAGNESEWADTALILDLTQQPLRWDSVAQPFRRRALNTAALDGKVFTIGGLTPDGSSVLEVNTFDPAARTWSDAPELPGSLMNGFNPAACVLGMHLFVSPMDGNVYRLNDKRDAWTAVAKLVKARFVHGMVPVRGNVMLVLGGASKTGSVAATETVITDCCTELLHQAPTAARGDVQSRCPILTSVPIGDDAIEVEYRGVKVKLCCAACVKKWNADPDAYLNAALLPQLKGMQLAARKLEQMYCPVYPDRVVSTKDPTVEYKGVVVYLFSEAAKKKFLANPEKYAVPEVLPQLRPK